MDKNQNESNTNNDTAGNDRKKRRWRLNLFDVAFILCVIVIAVVIVVSSGALGGSSLLSSGSQETVVYTIELQSMVGDGMKYIKAGDALVDRVEKRPIGTVVSVKLEQSKASMKDETGERHLVDVPGRTTAIVTVTADATVTESSISVGGFIVRVGTWLSVNGPLYAGTGFVVDIERDDLA